jgi:hypothetical protein
VTNVQGGICREKPGIFPVTGLLNPGPALVRNLPSRGDIVIPLADENIDCFKQSKWSS